MQCIKFSQFTRYVFDSPAVAQQAAPIIKAILEAKSPRLSAIARKMPGNADSAYKVLQRFLTDNDPRLVLSRLFQADAKFVLGDPTELPRRQAYKTAYVGKLKDHTRGFWLLLLATPFRGCAIPFYFVTYSSRTLAERAESRNQNHLRAFAGVKAVLGERPLVLDREFSYEWLLADLVAAQVHFVIRLNLGSNPPSFFDARGKRIELAIAQGQSTRVLNVRYRGTVRVNLSGVWQRGLHEPLWVMSDLSPESALQIYRARMKIDETFRDLKTLLHLDQIMNQQQAQMEKVIALMLLAFTIGLLVGEHLRDALYATPLQRHARELIRTDQQPTTGALHPKWACFSGLFVLLNMEHALAVPRLQSVVRHACAQFKTLVHGPV